jgi:hypothetical protein
MRAALRAVLLRGASTGLDLNFAGGVFSLNNTRTDSPANIPGWTFSRTDTNGTATALDLAGNVIQFATGVPRITNRGILVEEARTNKGTSHNANPTEAAGFVGNPVNMSKSGDAAGILSVVDDAAALAAAGLSGACTSGKAYKLDNTAGAANAIASINGTVGNLNAHAFSCYARATAGSGSVGRSGSSVGAATFSSSAYARVSAVLTPTATTEVLRVQALPGAVVYFILAQLEEGAFATSPIITTGAAGTRGADSALVNSLPALPTAFTMVAEWSREGGTDAATSYRVASLSRVADDSYSEIYQRHTNNVVRAFQRTLAANQADVTLGTGSIGAVQRAAARFVTNDVTGSFNGAAVVSDTVVTMPASPPLSFAAGSTNGTSGWLNGYIRRVQVLPFAATDAQLQSLTAP